MFKANLKLGIRGRNTHLALSTWIKIGNQILESETREELSNVVFDRLSPTNMMLNKKHFENISNLDTLKQRVLVHLVGRRIEEIIHKERSVRGPKSDKMRRFFDELTTEPQDIKHITDFSGLSFNTIKNHRRYDLFPERGLTKIKNGKIYRQPV